MALTHDIFYEKYFLLEPDCSVWVQEVNDDMEAFTRRCQALTHVTAGEPRSAWYFIQELSLEERIGLINEIINFDLILADLEDEKAKDRDFDLYSEACISWIAHEEVWDCSEIALDLCNDMGILEAGYDFLEMAEEHKLSDWDDPANRFHEFLEKTKGLREFGWGGAFDSDNRYRPLSEGGSSRIVDFGLEGGYMKNVGAVFLSPFPGIRPLENSTEKFKAYCKEFNNLERQKWFKDYHERARLHRNRQSRQTTVS